MLCEDFTKFPSTPHYSINDDGLLRNDKILSNTEKIKIDTSMITIEEKIDGANLGIYFNNDGVIQLQNRGKLLKYPYSGQWATLSNWINNKENELLDVLEGKFILFGEWCFAKHSIKYTKLPDWFIAFDIFDKTNQRFLNVTRRNLMLKRIGLVIVPKLYHGYLKDTNILTSFPVSRYCDDVCEGLYFRLDNEFWLELRAKYVRSNFIQTPDQHWSKSSLVKNSVIY